MAELDIFELGFSPELQRGSTGAETESSISSLSLYSSASGYQGGLTDLVNDTIQPQALSSGGSATVLFYGKTTFTDTTAGYRWGVDTDWTFKFNMGTTNQSIDWNVTTANTLTITGSLTVSAGGTIGRSEE